MVISIDSFPLCAGMEHNVSRLGDVHVSSVGVSSVDHAQQSHVRPLLHATARRVRILARRRSVRHPRTTARPNVE